MFHSHKGNAKKNLETYENFIVGYVKTDQCFVGWCISVCFSGRIALLFHFGFLGNRNASAVTMETKQNFVPWRKDDNLELSVENRDFQLWNLNLSHSGVLGIMVQLWNYGSASILNIPFL